jgi:hypothetical protein
MRSKRPCLTRGFAYDSLVTIWNCRIALLLISSSHFIQLIFRESSTNESTTTNNTTPSLIYSASGIHSPPAQP